MHTGVPQRYETLKTATWLRLIYHSELMKGTDRGLGPQTEGNSRESLRGNIS